MILLIGITSLIITQNWQRNNISANFSKNYLIISDREHLQRDREYVQRG
jgi:hypothetical protein